MAQSIQIVSFRPSPTYLSMAMDQLVTMLPPCVSLVSPVRPIASGERACRGAGRRSISAPSGGRPELVRVVYLCAWSILWLKNIGGLWFELVDLHVRHAIHVRADHFRRELRDDGIAIGA